eukprot:gene9215-16892_t
MNRLLFATLISAISVGMAQLDFGVRSKVLRWVEVAILTTPAEDITELNKAIISCQKLVNREWELRQSNSDYDTIRINVGKVSVPSESLFDQEILAKKELVSAAFIIEAYSVDPFSCVLSDLLGIPQITLTDEHNPSCKNVLSMRPDTAQLYDSTLAMIRRSQSRIVAVIIEAINTLNTIVTYFFEALSHIGYIFALSLDSMGETAIKFMSQGKLSQRFPFQVVGKVNFKKPETLSKAIRKLRDSGIKRVLMMMHSRHAEAVLAEVRNQGLELDDYKWFLPLMEFSVGLVNIHRLFNVAGVRIPSNQPKTNVNGQCNYPALYDAFNLVLNASVQFSKIEKFLEIKARDRDRVDKNFCPSKEEHDYGMELLQIAKKITFHGRTGNVRFLKSGYRDVSDLEATEIKEGGNIEKLGIWSSQCKKMIWNPNAKDDRKLVESGCRVIEESSGKHTDFQPQNTHLRVVTSEGPPFIFYDPAKSQLGNEAFQGFCKDLIDKLSKDLNFTYQMYIVTPGNYGGSSSNGTSNGMIRDLIRKDADIAIGSLTITAEREKAIDFTKPFMDFTMSLIMKKPPEAEVNFFTFLLPFQLELWLSVLAMIAAAGFSLYILDRYSPDGFRLKAVKKGEGTGEEFNLGNCLWFMTASFLQQGPDYTPREKSMETSIKSLEDLAKQDDIAYGVLDGGQTQSFFKNSKIPLYRKMFGQMQTKQSFATSTSSAIKDVRRGGYAYLTEHPMLSYHNQQSPCDTVLLRNLLEAKSYGLGLRIDSEWTNPLSVQILMLREKGVVEQMRRKWWDQKSSCPVETEATVKKSTAMDFMSLAGVYIILACGVAVAFILLFIEVKYPGLLKRKPKDPLKGKRSSEFVTKNGIFNGDHKKYLDAVDSGLVKPAQFTTDEDYHTSTKDYDYATKKYFDSLRSNKHYRE